MCSFTSKVLNAFSRNTYFYIMRTISLRNFSEFSEIFKYYILLYIELNDLKIYKYLIVNIKNYYEEIEYY